VKKADGQKRFIQKYNLLFNVPDNKATKTHCDKYKSEHSNEFKNSDWSIEKHRKRFMDWMSGQVYRASK
jgi:hypothetical protein